MKQKRMSVRFDLDIDGDRRAWEHLQALNTSRNRAVIDAINEFFEPVHSDITDAIRDTIRDCLKNATFVQPPEEAQSPAFSEDEAALLDSLDDLLGD